MRKGGVADPYPGRGAMEVLEGHPPHRSRTSREALDHRIDGIVAQSGEEARLPIIERSPRKAPIKHRVQLAVRHGADGVHLGDRNSLIGRPAASPALSGPQWQTT